MLVMFNFTGLRRVYWRPSVRWRADAFGLWFLESRWLGVEVIVYSKALGSELIRQFNALYKGGS